jgi:DNA invertase Pin-like site-specific DNA recombinase
MDSRPQPCGKRSQPLRDFCERWDGHELVAEYVDRESGTRGRRERADFDRMFADAARHRFDVLLFWALDRFSREGIRSVRDAFRLQRMQSVLKNQYECIKAFSETDLPRI